MHLPHIDTGHKHFRITSGTSGTIHNATPLDWPNVRPDDFMPVFSGVFMAPDVSGRLENAAANDDVPLSHTPGRSLFKRAVVFLYCWGILSAPQAQRAINAAQAWEA